MSGVPRVPGWAGWTLGACAIGLVVALAATGAAEDAASRFTVGSKKFTESVVLAELVHLLASSPEVAAESVHLRELGGTRVLWNALLEGELDAYPEYTGTLRQELLEDAEALSFGQLRERLARLGIAMTEPLGFENTYAIGMREAEAQRLGIETLSDLAAHPELALGFTNEFMDRGDGWPGLARTYGFRHADVRGLDHDLAYRGLMAGDVSAIDMYSTDAEIAYYELRALRDDRAYFPEYRAVLLYRSELAQRIPELPPWLERLGNSIPASRMIAMNAAVKLERRPESQVASEQLERSLGLDVRAEVTRPVERVLGHLRAHLVLVGISLTLAIGIAIPLGIACARSAPLGRIVLGTVGVIQTVPSLALLVFMIPVLGIGAPPAIAALFLYSLLPIVRNTYTGLIEIPPDLRESAEVLGLPGHTRLWRIELPLASRAILGGIKTSAVINIGTATLGALIGAGGLGQPILTGIRLDDVGLILQGAVPAALLALAAQLGFDQLERFVVPMGLRLEPGGAGRASDANAARAGSA